MALYVTLVTTLGMLAIVAVGLALVFGGALASPGGRDFVHRAFDGRETHPAGWAWIAATLATTGSLYLSEIMHFVPCSLCWYQRIVMYPLVIVLAVALYRRDTGVWRYVLPLSVVGLVIAAYHVAVQWQPSLDVGVCSAGVPCSGRYVSVFGFITIPAMAGSVFLFVSAMMLVLRSLEGTGTSSGIEEE